MATLAELKASSPAYADISDHEFASRVYAKHYRGKISYDEFAKRTGAPALFDNVDAGGGANDSDIANLVSGKPKNGVTYGFSPVSRNIGAGLDALQHHVLNIPQSIGQLAGHGVNALVQGVAGDTDFARRLQAETDAADAQIREREAAYQERTGTIPGSYVGAAAGEVLPWMAGVGAARSAGMLPKVGAGLKGLAAKGGLLAAEGAAMGAVQPVTEEGSYGAQKAAQVATGAAAAPLLAAGVRGVGALAGAAREGARYLTPAGREVVANKRVAGLLGDDPATVAALRAQAGVPGYTLTPAQAIGTPEAVQAERVLRNNGLTAPAFAAQESANNAALRDQVARMAGTDADVAAAKAARSAATDPVFNSLSAARADAAPVLKALDDLSASSLGVRPNIKNAATSLRSELSSRIGDDGKIPADMLSGIRENANSFLGPMSSAQERKALGPIKDSIVEALDAAVPGYRDTVAAYARASQPLTDMEAGRALLGAIDSGGRDAGGNQAVTLTQVKQILAKDAKAKFKMSKEARQTLEALRDTLQRRTITNNTIAATGPGTAADTMRGLGQSPFVQRIIGQLGGIAGGALGGAPGYGAGLLALEGINAANNAVVKQVGRKASNSLLAADSIEAYQRQLSQQQQGLLGQYGVPSYLLPYAPQ